MARAVVICFATLTLGLFDLVRGQIVDFILIGPSQPMPPPTLVLWVIGHFAVNSATHQQAQQPAEATDFVNAGALTVQVLQATHQIP